MNFYRSYVLPRIVHLACGTRPLMRQREKIVPQARGVVLEIGFGTGRNLSYYDRESVERLVGLEPAEEMWRIAEKEISRTTIEVEQLRATAEAIPAEDATFDTAVVTYTLCTVEYPDAALREIRRVLKPDGRLLFSEHGEAPDERVRRWQARINPIWRRLGGGCNLDRRIPELLTRAGFELEESSAMYVPGLKIASYTYWGVAR